ncbi:hypothetical protein V6N13_146251 [Hibiscus sabdariffa]
MAINAMGFSLRINPSFCFSQNPPKPTLLTIRCSLPLSSDSAATGLAERPWKVADTRLVLSGGLNPSVLLEPKYQEILTDPNYAGQFVLMTNPHIGNTGVNFDDEESRQCFLAGLVIRNEVWSPRRKSSCSQSQNHNYAVDPASLPDGVEVTHVNLNDGSYAGLAYPTLNVCLFNTIPKHLQDLMIRTVRIHRAYEDNKTSCLKESVSDRNCWATVWSVFAYP